MTISYTHLFQATALDLSIKKWEAIAFDGGKDGGTVDCALCRLNIYKIGDCLPCIIYQETGFTDCDGVDHDLWRNYQELEMNLSAEDIHLIDDKLEWNELLDDYPHIDRAVNKVFDEFSKLLAERILGNLKAIRRNYSCYYPDC